MARIGVQLMMLKEQVARSGPYAVLQRVREAGFRAVEVSQIPMTAENVAAMRRAREELGVEFGALSAGLGPGANDSLLDDHAKVVADARTLGAGLVRIAIMPRPAMASQEALLHFCRQAEEAAQRLADEGLVLCYHHHHVELARRGGVTVLDTILAEAPTLRLEVDVHWVQRGGKDPVRTLQAYAGRVDLVHLKDYRIGELAPEAFDADRAGDAAGFQRAFLDVVQFAEVGEGTLDWAAIVPAALDGGARYLFVEQDETYGRDPFDSLALSRDHLRELGFGDLF
ncbi:Sugar phosphate isomerase/epimerase [Microlunatus flavus]|uniref:Sugar phosphate isomerase/epimerase n=2 Tax=Microlunatus flavus TaxID=1036181 RepID=A0A1H9G417_9ACTN|nr:Sugar phosphate isomerase/epimerase [Microlunatus flavus]